MPIRSDHTGHWTSAYQVPSALSELLTSHDEASNVCRKVEAMLRHACDQDHAVICRLDEPAIDQVAQDVLRAVADAKPSHEAICAQEGRLLINRIMLQRQVRTRFNLRLEQKAEMARARRLYWKYNNELVSTPNLGDGLSYHIFLSHDWNSESGRDVMRIMKSRLQDLFAWRVERQRNAKVARSGGSTPSVLKCLPTLKVFLDVDDLKHGNGPEYLHRSDLIVFYVCSSFFERRNAIQELLHAVKARKRLIALMEPERAKGGLSRGQLFTCLEIAFQRHDLVSRVHKEHSPEQCCCSKCLTPQQVFEALVATEPIEWDRIGCYQDIGVRRIAEALLGEQGQDVYVQDELSSRPLPELNLEQERYHLYVSKNNFRADELVKEATAWLAAAADNSSGKQELRISTRIEDLPRCDHMLLYLTSQTWGRGSTSETLADEVAQALDRQVSLLLAHEAPSLEGRLNDARHACPFEDFFKSPPDGTPVRLLNANVYGTIAIPLRPNTWFRPVSLRLLVDAIAGPPQAVSQADDDSQSQSLASIPSWRMSSRFNTTRQMASTPLSKTRGVAGALRQTSVARLSTITKRYKAAMERRTKEMILLEKAFLTIARRKLGGPFLMWRTWAYLYEGA